jgi:hypothetical protein
MKEGRKEGRNVRMRRTSKVEGGEGVSLFKREEDTCKIQKKKDVYIRLRGD